MPCSIQSRYKRSVPVHYITVQNAKFTVLLKSLFGSISSFLLVSKDFLFYGKIVHFLSTLVCPKSKSGVALILVVAVV